VRHLPTILFVLSLPAGAIAYALTVQVLTSMLPAKSNDVLILLIALFVAGLVMLPFLIPFFDRKAKRDLAAYRSAHPDLAEDSPAPVDDKGEST
jgi:undecaprenyl pyrophosphate phosphatase UppP